LIALILPLIASQLINLGVFAKYSYFFFSSSIITIENIVLAFVLFGYYGLAGYGLSRLLGLSKDDRISTIISMIYINNILIVVFAQQFFGTEIAALAAFFNIPYYVGILLLKKTLKPE
jgi:BASS family bile acid:Na+ symporter